MCAPWIVFLFLFNVDKGYYDFICVFAFKMSNDIILWIQVILCCCFFLLSTRFNNRSDLITNFFYRQMKIDSKIMFIRYLVSKVVKAANSITSWNKMNLMKILYTSTKEKELIESMFIEIQRKFFLMMSLGTEGSSI